MAYLLLVVGLQDEVALDHVLNVTTSVGASPAVPLPAGTESDRPLALAYVYSALRSPPPYRHGIDSAFLMKLAACARERGVSLPALMFGSEAAQRSASGGAEGGGALQLPMLPSCEELGVEPEAMAALESFQQQIARLHTTARTAPLGALLQEIVEQVRFRALGGNSSWFAECHVLSRAWHNLHMPDTMWPP